MPKPVVTLSPYSRMWRKVEEELKRLNPEDQLNFLIKVKYKIKREDLESGSVNPELFPEDRAKFYEKILLKINELDDLGKTAKKTINEVSERKEASGNDDETIAESSHANEDDELAIEKKGIIEFFETMDKMGYKYAFRKEKDFRKYVEILARFFLGMDYKLPQKPIQMRKTSKTRVASVLGEIYENHNRDYKISKSKNEEFLNLVRVLEYFQDHTDIQLSKRLTTKL